MNNEQKMIAVAEVPLAVNPLLSEGIIVISLFDGMSCGQIALQDMGVKVKQYYAAEIDKHAIAQTQLNFPNTIQLGSVTDWQKWDIDWQNVGLILAGSPCQGFSFAGKKLAFDDPRSKLFFVFIDILKHVQKHNPSVKYLLENVKMAKEHELVISRYCNVAPIDINSALVSAQNRQRLYWTNIANNAFGLFGDMVCSIPQPKDKGILLKDILESEVDGKYYIKNPKFGFDGMNLNAKSNTLRIGGGASQDDKHNFDLIKIDVYGNPKDNQDKASCFTAGGNSGGNHSDMDLILIPEATKKGFIEVKPGECFDAENLNSETRRGRKMEDKSNCLMAKETDFMQYTNDFKIRRLTPTECSRLQTIPSWYKWQCSDTQQYRMLGNGWTVSVIKHILSFMNVE